MTKQEREKYIRYMSFKEELEEEKRHGYRLSFSGREASPEEIARICIFEEGSSYMRDYVADQNRNTTTLDFIPLNL